MAIKGLRLALSIIAGITVFAALVFGILAGVAIASTKNIMAEENFRDFDPALPSRILDINGRLITEFVSDEKRELVSISQLPQHLIDAFIAREDRDFWTHPGFTVRGYARAVLGELTGQNLGGGSTITVQLAGTLYADRRERSYRRKVIELWYALQLERRFTKSEILEMYLNRIIMGPGVFGVEAACKYFFGHSASEITIAEAAILAIQPAAPDRHNPITNPNVARDLSDCLLDTMVDFGFVEAEAANESFALYWDNYDYTRISAGGFFMREDQAPWFSEYVRRELATMLYGSVDLFRDGLTVHTTLNLDYQAAADRYMQRYISQVNNQFERESTVRWAEAERLYAPLAEMIGLAFNLEDLFFQQSRLESRVMEYYKESVNPAMDALALMLGLDELKQATNASFQSMQMDLERTKVEGTLVTIDNESGHILSLVGGSTFSQANQLIRATQGEMQPGSCFKPLYYSAAIDSRSFTMGTLIYDAPVVFYNEDGTPYIPLNFRGAWTGQVLTWYALSHSMNVPSVKVLDGIGFDAAINRAATLLNIQDPAQIRRTFPRFYPLALGIIRVSPLQMARAYAVFANQGREVTPIAVRYIEDRNGRIILEPEKELRSQQKQRGSAIQVVSPQNAYVMTRMLQEVVREGTLAWPARQGTVFTYQDENGHNFTIPSAGKTGTTQNWADAWTIGFTPYMTTAIWFGFDRPGNSLGVSQSGATIAGDAWARYMSEIHRGLPFKDFIRPQNGLIDVRVCSVSGLLPTEQCNEGTVSLVYYEGTQPFGYCDLHQERSEYAEDTIRRIESTSDILQDVNLDSSLDVDLSDINALYDRLLQQSNPGTQTTGQPGSAQTDSIEFQWLNGSPGYDPTSPVTPSPQPAPESLPPPSGQAPGTLAPAPATSDEDSSDQDTSTLLD